MTTSLLGFFLKSTFLIASPSILLFKRSIRSDLCLLTTSMLTCPRLTRNPSQITGVRGWNLSSYLAPRADLRAILVREGSVARILGLLSSLRRLACSEKLILAPWPGVVLFAVDLGTNYIIPIYESQVCVSLVDVFLRMRSCRISALKPLIWDFWRVLFALKTAFAFLSWLRLYVKLLSFLASLLMSFFKALYLN